MVSTSKFARLRDFSFLERIVTLPSGRRAKWMILVLWLAVMAITGSFAGSLPQIENNNAIAYLPSSAPSTKLTSSTPSRKGIPENQRLMPLVLRVVDASSGRCA